MDDCLFNIEVTHLTKGGLTYIQVTMNPPGILVCTSINTGYLEQKLQWHIQNRLSILLHRGMCVTSRHQSSGAMCCLHFKVKVKVKFSRYRPSVATRVGRGIALLFHDHGTRRGWVISSTPRPHFTPGKDPVPILQEAEWAPGSVWTGGKSRPHRDSIPDRPARSSVAIPTELPAHPF